MSCIKVKNIVNRVHTIKKEFANIVRGEQVYCFAETETTYWINLPREWLGVRDIQVDKSLFLQSI